MKGNKNDENNWNWPKIMLLGGLPLFIIIALAAIVPVVRLSKSNAKTSRQLTKIYQAIELYSEQNDGHKPRFLYKIVETGLLSVQDLQTPADTTKNGFFNDFGEDPLLVLRQITIRQSAVTSFDLYGWAVINKWPDQGQNGLVILPTEMAPNYHSSPAFFGVLSFARIHENGEVVFRNRRGYELATPGYELLFRETPKGYGNSKQSP
ncbi:MAG: hypothetical protein R2688_10815 [Fimbriimonadaceae bacterium]